MVITIILEKISLIRVILFITEFRGIRCLKHGIFIRERQSFFFSFG